MIATYGQDEPAPQELLDGLGRLYGGVDREVTERRQLRHDYSLKGHKVSGGGYLYLEVDGSWVIEFYDGSYVTLTVEEGKWTCEDMSGKRHTL